MLEEVADELTVGYVGPMASEYVPSGIPFLRSQNVEPLRVMQDDIKFITPDFHKRISKSALSPGDVVIVRTGKPGACTVMPDSLPVANCSDLVIVRCGKKLDARFLAYYVNTVAAHHVSAHLVGAVQQHFNVGSARKLKMLLPEIGEQRAIASVLGSLDDKIELNRRMNETLEALAQSLFKSWFVDFDPVRSKMPGKSPSSLEPATASLFPDQFQDSELGEIPKGWTVKSIEEVSSRVAIGPFGSSIKVETFVSEGMPIISGQHLHGLMLEDSTFNFITQAHAEQLKNSIVQRGDVVFTHAGNIGQVAFIPEHSRYERYIISQRQFFMRCDLSQVTPSFITLYFKSHEGQHRLLANTSSSGVPSIARPVTNLRSIQLTIPSKPVLDAFQDFVRPLLIRVRHNDEESRRLAALRDALLPKLLSGELRVPAKSTDAS